MDYKKIIYRISLFLVIGMFLVLAHGCGHKEKFNTANTCYIEMINSIDSLKKMVGRKMNWQVVFYKDNEPQIRSVNFLAEDETYPGMIFYRPLSDLGKDTPVNTHKLQIELAGNYSVDSTYYCIRQFKYVDKQWKKVSDQGFSRATLDGTSLKGTDSFRFRVLVQQIVTNSFAAVHNK